VARNGRRSRGFTLIEAVVATFILVVVVAAMFGSWSACFNQSAQIQEITGAANIAQSELEIAKVYGALNMPLGTYNSTTQTATWTGAYIPATGWTSGATAYYDYTGTQVASSTATGAFYSLTVTVTDSTVLPGTGSTYTLQQTSNRAVVATVSNLASGAVDFVMATNLVEGGL